MSNQKVITINQALEDAKKCNENGNPNDALKIYGKVIDNYPENIEAIFRRGKLFHQHSNYQYALKDFTKLLELDSAKHIVHINLADTYVALKQHNTALEHYLKAITIKPDFEEAYIPAVSLMERLGKLQEAANIVANGIKTLPKSSELYFLKGKIHLKRKELEMAEKAYAEAVKIGLSKRAKHVILGEYASVKQKLKKYDEAMELYIQSQEAASQTATAKAMSPKQNGDIIDASKKWFSADDIKGWENEKFTGKQDPVFLVGFPRSGTTLMEQILFAHPHLTVTDELQVLPAKMVYINRVLKREIPFPHGYSTLSHEELQTWRDEYFAAMGRSMPNLDPNLRIVDKNPISFIYFGAIKRFFPEAPILMMIRDPRDVCLSCFIQTFAPNSDTVNFYTLENTAKYYAKAMDLYLQFRDSLGLNLLQVKYEDLCADFENHAHKIIDHIGEPWDDAVLEYYKKENSRFIQTPSYEAVTKPINKNAVGKWQNYEEYFQPILPILEPYLKEFGYK